MNRPIDNGTTFVTGGDVSRFQRRTAPIAPRPQQYTAIPAQVTVSVATGQQAPRPRGPVVRVTRGKTTTEEQFGGN